MNLFENVLVKRERGGGWVVIYLHLDCALGSEVSLKNLLEAFSSVDVDTEGCGLADHIGLRVYEL